MVLTHTSFIVSFAVVCTQSEDDIKPELGETKLMISAEAPVMFAKVCRKGGAGRSGGIHFGATELYRHPSSPAAVGSPVAGLLHSDKHSCPCLGMRNVHPGDDGEFLGTD